MCKYNSDCSSEGREDIVGRRCMNCNTVKADCSNCGNTWTYNASETVMDSCPECGRH